MREAPGSQQEDKTAETTCPPAGGDAMLPWEEGGRAKEVIKTRSGRSQTAGVWAGDTRRTVVTTSSALCQASLTAAGMTLCGCLAEEVGLRDFLYHRCTALISLPLLSVHQFQCRSMKKAQLYVHHILHSSFNILCA